MRKPKTHNRKLNMDKSKPTKYEKFECICGEKFTVKYIYEDFGCWMSHGNDDNCPECDSVWIMKIKLT
jgi:hypothetical protein